MISRIELVKDSEQVRKLYDFIKIQPFDYPNYDGWIEKCFRELQLGYKKAFVCLLEDEVIGNIIFQRHKEYSNSIELKNGRVNPEHRRRKVFSRLYRHVENYAKEGNYKRIITDTHSDNLPVIIALRNLGFHIETNEILYNNRLETILVKDIFKIK